MRKQWLWIGGNTIDLGDLDSVLRFVFVNWENHHTPNVRLEMAHDELGVLITFPADWGDADHDIEEMISFARQHKIKLTRK